MNRFRIISDMHSEFWPENFYKARKLTDRLIPPMPDDEDTILLLAGDIGSHRRRNVYKALIDRLCDRFREVIDIPGNHFWYGSDCDADTAPAERGNYRFGSTVTAPNITAATLWADFAGGNPLVELQCVEDMNDFRRVLGLTPDLVKARHAEHIRFLKERIEPGGVVMTHFAPSWRSLPESRKTDPCNAYYASDLEDLILDTRPAVWVHGHIHTACDYRIGETRVLCNPAGYDGRDHDPHLSFTV